MPSRAISLYLIGQAEPITIAASRDDDLIEKLADSINRDVSLVLAPSDGRRLLIQPKNIAYGIED